MSREESVTEANSKHGDSDYVIVGMPLCEALGESVYDVRCIALGERYASESNSNGGIAATGTLQVSREKTSLFIGQNDKK